MKLFQFFFRASFVISLGSGALTTNDKEDSVYLAAVTIGVSVQVVKVFYIIWRKNEILTFIHQIYSVIVEYHDEYSSVNNKVKNLMKFGKIYMLLCCITLVFAFVFYAVEGQRNLPLNIAFPLDWNNSEIGYWVAFVYLAIHSTLYSMISLVVNILIWYLMSIFAIKYELLGKAFKRMGAGQRNGIFRKQKNRIRFVKI